MPPSNRLSKEQSPYLLQHSHNPVDWFPWGEEAFLRSRNENKPIFLSIGYSTCHWCHVMEYESFENEEIARFLNDHFICIKVDREERPDIDRVYMAFVQATTGSGGWPMSVWLTPELKPFVGGTYFPPQDNYGRAGFPTVLNRIIEAWQTKREAILEQSNELTLAIQGETLLGKSVELTIEPLRKFYDYLVRGFDKEWAGFGDAPKFPRPVSLNALVRISASKHFSGVEQTNALRMLRETLLAMARGGMNDHLGGGFHRYSVDRFWHVPHFEKMLYDQAQLAISYLEIWLRSSGGEKSARKEATNILEYVMRDLISPEGGFFSAEDADSLTTFDSKKKMEGAFYIWKKAEIDTILKEDAELFCQFYDVSLEGNAPEGSDPHHEFIGENILYQKLGFTRISKLTGLDKTEVEQKLTRAKKVLLDVRNQRPRPLRDDKIITSWNGLMISAFARCGSAFEQARYLDVAKKAADFVLTKLITLDGNLARSFRGVSSNISAFADDYAFLIQGLLDLYECTFESRWLEEACRLQKKQDELFLDQENNGYFSTRKDTTDLIARLKDDYDGAEPSANAVSAINLLRLSTMLGKSDYRLQAIRALQSLAPIINGMPQAVPQMLVAVDLALASPCQIVLAGDPNTMDFQVLAQEIRRRFLPHLSLLHAEDCQIPMPLIQGKAAAYLCENFVCRLPVSNADGLARLLTKK